MLVTNRFANSSTPVRPHYKSNSDTFNNSPSFQNQMDRNNDSFQNVSVCYDHSNVRPSEAFMRANRGLPVQPIYIDQYNGSSSLLDISSPSKPKKNVY